MEPEPRNTNVLNLHNDVRIESSTTCDKQEDLKSDKDIHQTLGGQQELVQDRISRQSERMGADGELQPVAGQPISMSKPMLIPSQQKTQVAPIIAEAQKQGLGEKILPRVTEVDLAETNRVVGMIDLQISNNLSDYFEEDDSPRDYVKTFEVEVCHEDADGPLSPSIVLTP